MKKIVAVVLLFTTCAFAAEFKGLIMDQKCSGKPEMRGNSECAQKCIKAGSPAVLVSPDGKVYKLAEQDKAVPFAGKNVTISGSLKGDTISVASIK